MKMVKIEAIVVQTTNCTAKFSSDFISLTITAFVIAVGEANKEMSAGYTVMSNLNKAVFKASITAKPKVIKGATKDLKTVPITICFFKPLK